MLPALPASYPLPAVTEPVQGSGSLCIVAFPGDTMRAARKKQVVCLCDCEPQPREWLWPSRVAAGKLTVIDGDPSQGKSLLTLDLVARLTTARAMPEGTRSQGGHLAALGALRE